MSVYSSISFERHHRTGEPFPFPHDEETLNASILPVQFKLQNAYHYKGPQKPAYLMHRFKNLMNWKSPLYVRGKCCKEIAKTKPMEAASRKR